MRKKLHQLIDEMNDEKTAAVFKLFEEKSDIDLQRKGLIMAERDRYLNGKGKSYSWGKVKEMAVNKGRRHAI